MQKIFIKTFGCTLNQKDSEEITKNIAIETKIENITKKDKLIVNTCGVKEQTQTKIINFLKKIKKKVSEKNIYVCGCLVDIDILSIKEVLPNAKYFKVKEIKKLQKEIRTVKKIKTKQKKTEIIIISNGCLGNCAYCAVKFARGKLKSKPINKILKEINSALKNGAKEILLTSQDNACYGFDINTNIVELLKEITKIKKEFKIRNGMGNPQYIKLFLKELIQIYKNEKIYKFLHIPIQSGNNKVLKEMNRYYTIEEVEYIIQEFRKEIPDITIATDIIVGYPTEDNDQFIDTLKFIKKIKPKIINISRFGQRKNIEANKYVDLKGNIKKQRSREITKICEKIVYEENKKYIGKTLDVFINQKGKNNTFTGRTNNYITVVTKNKCTLYKMKKLKIKNCSTYYLIA
ncbi:MAG: tRNA (N(6)-L-threonylcarbamoyladenosine(37)-C(2))-methylthiotransferase [Candidatus ainarchaeum sp.]|nr:tRNA (N(6)-L-threonylcarbamoyladenosine(37)-C(2))-methylthiotransferase [Candidatus ainarchaeum sp.]MDD3975873.1 tRNA (N(6)-L-threonylcarbamoyladenosine(37)-C(2))-methylthiotransferase [Candidatus ainarchaeum sp.]